MGAAAQRRDDPVQQAGLRGDREAFLRSLKSLYEGYRAPTP